MWSGSCVAFRLGDAICPDMGQIVAQMGPDLQVCGEIVFCSDRGTEKSHFAIISAAGIDTPLIVPVSSLELVVGGAMKGRGQRLTGGGDSEGQEDALVHPKPKGDGHR
ncbi:MAG: hypothetical protein ACYS7M_04540 [Planctomycetota bacterium]|jgi:hypothetical protein